MNDFGLPNRSWSDIPAIPGPFVTSFPRMTLQEGTRYSNGLTVLTPSVSKSLTLRVATTHPARIATAAIMMS